MAGYPGSVGLTGYIAPADTLDTYALQDEKFNRGGYRSVLDLTERDAIEADRRKLGMLVYCFSDSKFYTLKTGLINADWEEADLGGEIKTIGEYDGGGDEAWIQKNDVAFYARNWDSGSNLNMYLEFNEYKKGRVIHVFNMKETTGFGIPQVYTTHGAEIKDETGSMVQAVDVPEGAVCILTCDGTIWRSKVILNSNGGAGNYEDIPSNSHIVDSGKYFIYGSNTELTIDYQNLNREFDIKSIGTSIVKFEDGIIDGVHQDIYLNTGDALRMVVKEDDTCWIISKY